MLQVFSTDVGGRPHLYWLGVYVTGGDVFVVEATGDEAVLDAKAKASVEETIASVELSG